MMLKQEEEVHGKQRELDRLKDEEKELMTDMKKSEREIQRIEDDLRVVQDLEAEVGQPIPLSHFWISATCGENKYFYLLSLLEIDFFCSKVTGWRMRNHI